MMNLIHTVHTEFNQNIFTDNFKNSNYVNWIATNLAGTLMEESANRRYEEGKVQRLYINGYDVADTYFSTVYPTDFSFIPSKSGLHSFAIRTQVLSLGGNYPDVKGAFFINKLSDMSIVYTCEFAAGTSALPLGTFNYDKWQTIYQNVELVAGTEYFITGVIYKEVGYTPGVLEIFFGGYKMEYIEDRVFNIPTYYTKPTSNDNTSSGYRELSELPETIHSYDKMFNILSGTFSLNLPSSKGIKGKEFEFINSGNGIVTLIPVGVETIEGKTSFVLPAITGIKLKSNGLVWKLIDRFRQETLNRTQWITNIALTSVANTSSLNLLTLIPNASKIANGTDGGIHELNITSNSIKTIWRGNIMVHHIRLTLTVATGSDQHALVTLRRTSDNSVLGIEKVNRDADTGLLTAQFMTYTYSATDPFVTDGFYFSFDNNSGVSLDLTTSLNLLITTYFK